MDINTDAGCGVLSLTAQALEDILLCGGIGLCRAGRCGVIRAIVCDPGDVHLMCDGRRRYGVTEATTANKEQANAYKGAVETD